MAKWVIVVDDDTASLKMAGLILSKNNMRVTALKSGAAFLSYVTENGTPDIVLLDVNMPGLDGFQTLKRLRKIEADFELGDTPVIFLTSDEDSYTEKYGFEAGVSDFIRKPFHPDVLLQRINYTVSNHETLQSLKALATTDKLTGMLNKSAAELELTKRCISRKGCLVMADLDSFKLVNDIHGHEMGDKLLVDFAKLISYTVPMGSVSGRMGGDEFTFFLEDVNTEEEVSKISEKLNSGLVELAKHLMGKNMDIPLGVSLGVVFVPDYGNNYDELIKLADKALYSVKRNGKHGYAVYNADAFKNTQYSGERIDIRTISSILGERNIPDVALQLDKDAFIYVYRYVMRYVLRNQITACKVLITLTCSQSADPTGFSEKCTEFGDHIRCSLRKTDIVMRIRPDQYFVFLTDTKENFINKIIDNIISGWTAVHGSTLSASYETELVGEEEIQEKNIVTGNIAIVDDDPLILTTAGRILSKNGYHVKAFKSGKALIDYVEDDIPDLILLDINMPVLDGFETLKRLRSMKGLASEIPVIFLTADDSRDTERMGLSLGATDYIVKPFEPEILLLRVKNILELITLQRNLSVEVERKTKENQNLFIHVVKSLADAIDAKDAYTNGHSDRVASYAQEIAKRAGYSDKDLDYIYIIALLHDVGKIGVPDDVINKPAKLTDSEFEMIREHPVMGAHILQNIKEMPKLAIGARSHHERYGGGGYPEGIKGEDIPEEARIIAVADAYDAMTSRRSYREPMSQAAVREEIEKCKGTQFDPKFADIMLEMIDEDKDFTMREHINET